MSMIPVASHFPPARWLTCSTQHPGYSLSPSRPSIGMHQDVSLLQSHALHALFLSSCKKSLFLIHPCSFLPQRIFSRWDVGAGTESPGCRPPWEREAGSLHESFFSTGVLEVEVVHARAAKRHFARVVEPARSVSWEQADACVAHLSPLADGRPTSRHACRPSLHRARAFRLPFPKGGNRSCCT